MDAQELRDKPVVALDSAERVGRVSDVLFWTDPLRLAGLRVATQAGDYVLPFDGVASFGHDAVTVESDQAVRRRASMASIDDLPGLIQLAGLKVVDESGTYQGIVRTLDVDATKGDVTALEVESGGILGLGGERTNIPIDLVRSVGPEVVTVRAMA
jgi:sporulation protein YlmC with PRC-barrel domain